MFPLTISSHSDECRFRQRDATLFRRITHRTKSVSIDCVCVVTNDDFLMNANLVFCYSLCFFRQILLLLSNFFFILPKWTLITIYRIQTHQIHTNTLVINQLCHGTIHFGIRHSSKVEINARSGACCTNESTSMKRKCVCVFVHSEKNCVFFYLEILWKHEKWR